MYIYRVLMSREQQWYNSHFLYMILIIFVTSIIWNIHIMFLSLLTVYDRHDGVSDAFWKLQFKIPLMSYLE
jgi:hypothetical protein